jgi:predicted ATPase
MITYIKINGFKSFHNFEMEFTPFTVIAGANASGKSNLFDALKLLGRLAETDLKTAFSEQRGTALELFTQYNDNIYASEMSFLIEMLLNRNIKDNWGGQSELNCTRLRYKLIIERRKNKLNIDDLYVKEELLEKIKPEDDIWVKYMLSKETKTLAKNLKAGGSSQPYIKTEKEGDTIAIKIRQDGKQGGKATPANAISQTVLGGVNSIDFPHVFAVKEEMKSWKFLQLNPEDLREPTRQDLGLRDEITESGKNLAAALFRIKQQDGYFLKEISRRLQKFLPNFIEVDVIDDNENKQYLIKLKDKDKKEYTSRILSEGTLRILALCILGFDDKHTGLLCFEEPENGIHPFRIKTMAELLKDLSTDFVDSEIPLRQVIVNTHSPVLVGNILDEYLSDKNVGIWFSQMINRNAIIQDKKTGFSVTVMENPFGGSQSKKEIGGVFAEQEQDAKRKYTLSNVKKYLESSDFEDLKTKLN